MYGFLDFLLQIEGIKMIVKCSTFFNVKVGVSRMENCLTSISSVQAMFSNLELSHIL